MAKKKKRKADPMACDDCTSAKEFAISMMSITGYVKCSNAKVKGKDGWTACKKTCDYKEVK